MTHFFCTYFDQGYLSRGLALYQSLKHHCPDFQLWVLCMDDACYEFLIQRGLPNIYPLALEDFEKGNEKLLKAKQNRSRIEYYFTCTPALPLFIFKQHPKVDFITYLDADLFFFADLEPIFAEIGEHSVAIIEHRFPPNFQHLIMHGIYNVGWLSFRRDEAGFECLNWWHEKCLEWCYDRLEDDKFADQKYLDHFPTLFKHVIVLQHKGANLAPWNLANYNLLVKEGKIWVDEQLLIFFHFHGLKQINRWLYNPNLEEYLDKPSQIVRQRIFIPYIRKLLVLEQQSTLFLAQSPSFNGIRPQNITLTVETSPLQKLRRFLRICKRTLQQKYIFVV